MYLMSSESSRFSITVVPSASAASSRTRFESDFDPGSLIVPEISLMGFNVRESVSSWAAATEFVTFRDARAATEERTLRLEIATRACTEGE